MQNLLPLKRNFLQRVWQGIKDLISSRSRSRTAERKKFKCFVSYLYRACSDISTKIEDLLVKTRWVYEAHHFVQVNEISEQHDRNKVCNVVQAELWRCRELQPRNCLQCHGLEVPGPERVTCISRQICPPSNESSSSDIKRKTYTPTRTHPTGMSC
jgi:hypothetical protein